MQTVYQQILEMINSQELASGQRIKETTLSQHLNISRIPLREALKELEKDGVIEKISPRITVVKTLNQEEMNNLSLCREEIEGLACHQARQRIQTGEVNTHKLREIHERIHQSIITQNFEEFIRSGYEFHRHIGELSGNSFIISIMNKLIC